MNKKKVEEVLNRLDAEYPQAGCALDHRSPFELLVATVLSAQTTDKSVNQVTPTLFEAYPDAKAMSQADEEEISRYIRRIGLYKTKAKNLVNLSKKLVEDFAGEVPNDRDALMTLPGVGRKTANVVQAEAFGEQRIAVDTHVFRVSNRIGLAHEDDVLKTEKALMKAIPEDSWSHAHHLLIFHGRNCCSARKPACEGCCLLGVCEQNL